MKDINRNTTLSKIVALSCFLLFFSSSQAQKIKWMQLENAQEVSMKDSVPILIYFTSSNKNHVRSIERYEAKMFGNKDLIKYINDNFHPVKVVLWGDELDSVKYNGLSYLTNDLASSWEMNVTSAPSYRMINGAGNLLNCAFPSQGLRQEPDHLLGMLNQNKTAKCREEFKEPTFCECANELMVSVSPENINEWKFENYFMNTSLDNNRRSECSGFFDKFFSYYIHSDSILKEEYILSEIAKKCSIWNDLQSNLIVYYEHYSTIIQNANEEDLENNGGLRVLGVKLNVEDINSRIEYISKLKSTNTSIE